MHYSRLVASFAVLFCTIHRHIALFVDPLTL